MAWWQMLYTFEMFTKQRSSQIFRAATSGYDVDFKHHPEKVKKQKNKHADGNKVLKNSVTHLRAQNLSAEKYLPF